VTLLLAIALPGGSFAVSAALAFSVRHFFRRGKPVEQR
jgi:hypothetical protein